jgi:hypothetical protein
LSRLLVSQRLRRRGLLREEPVQRLHAQQSHGEEKRRRLDWHPGCDGKIPNCLPIVKGWNYTVWLYRPRAEILHGKWKFPEPQPVN